MRALRILQFDNLYYLPTAYDMFKEVIKSNFEELRKINSFNKKRPLSYLYMALSDKDDKFVVINSIKFLEEDIREIHDTRKRIILLTTPEYNIENNELYPIEHPLHLPKIIKTANPARPALFFYNNRDIKNRDKYRMLIDTLSKFLRNDDILTSRETWIKKEIDFIFFERFSDLKGVLIYNNNIYGNFDTEVVKLENLIQKTLYF